LLTPLGKLTKKSIKLILKLYRSIHNKITIFRENRKKKKEKERFVNKEIEKLKGQMEREALDYLFRNYKFKHHIKDGHISTLEIINSDNFIEHESLESILKYITEFKELKRLSLINLEISKISLSELNNLIDLNLSNNKIQKFDSLSNIPNLLYLNLSNNSIASIQKINEFPKLVELNLNSNNIVNLDWIDENFPRLKKLHMADNLLKEINGFLYLSELSHLNLSKNNIFNIKNLENNYNLQHLDLSHNNIEHINNLKNNERLKFLDLSYNKIRKIEQINHLKYLRRLYLANNDISEIKNIDQLKLLRELNLSNNKIKELKGIGNLNQLTKEGLILDNNKFSSKIMLLIRNAPIKKIIKYSQKKEMPPILEKSKESINKQKKTIFKYDFAISFAGEDREIVEEMVKLLTKDKKVRVFYDNYFESEIIGKKLSIYFQEKYGKQTRYVIILISKHYPLKDWTNLELSIARDEANKRKEEFILPIRLDDTKILGIHDDIGFIDLRKKTIEETIALLIEKLELREIEK
jgi:Leucine-rich repeat (LRR) protein